MNKNKYLTIGIVFILIVAILSSNYSFAYIPTPPNSKVSKLLENITDIYIHPESYRFYDQKNLEEFMGTYVSSACPFFLLGNKEIEKSIMNSLGQYQHNGKLKIHFKEPPKKSNSLLEITYRWNATEIPLQGKRALLGTLLFQIKHKNHLNNKNDEIYEIGEILTNVPVSPFIISYDLDTEISASQLNKEGQALVKESDNLMTSAIESADSCAMIRPEKLSYSMKSEIKSITNEIKNFLLMHKKNLN